LKIKMRNKNVRGYPSSRLRITILLERPKRGKERRRRERETSETSGTKSRKKVNRDKDIKGGDSSVIGLVGGALARQKEAISPHGSIWESYSREKGLVP